MVKVNIKTPELRSHLFFSVSMNDFDHIFVCEKQYTCICVRNKSRKYRKIAIFINVASDVLYLSSDYNSGLQNLIWGMYITNTPKGNKAMIIS